jgi:hypothetical protein
VGTAILQNGLKSRLPACFLANFPQGAEISYSVIPLVKTLPEPLRSQVQAAFANSISRIWIVVMIIGAVGIVATLPMKQMALRKNLHENWGFQTNQPSLESKLDVGSSRVTLAIGSDDGGEKKRAASFASFK